MATTSTTKYNTTTYNNKMATTSTTKYNTTTCNNKMDAASIRRTCQYGTLDDVNNLIHQNIDVNIPDLFGLTPIFDCIQSNKQPAEKVKLLVSVGAMLNVEDVDGRSLLHYACWYGTTDCINYFLEQGFDVNGRDDNNRTPLFYCVRSAIEPLEKVKLLVSAGAMLDVEDYEGCSLLHHACWYSTTDCINYLLEQGLDVNGRDIYNKTPLFYCVDSDKQPAEKVKLLVSFGAMLDVKDRRGRSLLYYACWYSTTDCINYLLEQGLDVNGRDNNNRTPLFYCVASDKHQLEKVKLLVSFGAMLDVKDRRGSSLLHWARAFGKKDCESYFRELGLDK